MSAVELTAVGGFLTAVVGAVVAVVRLRPDRDALIITQAQGAATIYDDLVRTLHAEIERQREEIVQLRSERDHLVVEVAGLRERFGTRRTDTPPEGPTP